MIFKNRGEHLRSSVAFALIGAVKVVRGLNKGLNDDERYAVADQVVYDLKKYGDPWDLEKELPEVHPAELGHAFRKP